MAYEDYLASKSWTSLPAPEFRGGLLETGLTPYQKAMEQMKAYQATSNQQLNSLLETSGGYRPGIFLLRSVEDLLSKLSNITDVRGGPRNPSEQARINAFFDAMTPAELAAFQSKNAEIINAILAPNLVKIYQDIVNNNAAETAVTSPVTQGTATGTALPPATTSPTSTDAVTSPVSQGTVTGTPVGNLGAVTSPVSQGEAIGVPLGLLGSPSTSPVSQGEATGVPVGNLGAVTSPVSQSTVTGTPLGLLGSPSTSSSGGGGGGTGIGIGSGATTAGSTSVSSGASLGGLSTGMTAGPSSGQSTSSSSGGGGGGGGGGCCFIMLEARYGDGTMDRVVRRYRDEKVTEKNKRGYYKLAEVFIPLMRKSKLFSFFVVKTFADPAVCYAKWYYGENKWGWIFKPLERFWMKLFDTLGTETKFIRENGETV